MTKVQSGSAKASRSSAGIGSPEVTSQAWTGPSSKAQVIMMISTFSA